LRKAKTWGVPERELATRFHDYDSGKAGLVSGMGEIY
jgi:hypothetical protein